MPKTLSFYPNSYIVPLSRGELYMSLLFALFFISLLPSCKPDTIQNGTAQKYFDIQGYFKADAARLQKLNHLILKTVTHNGITETKKVHINNWQIELGLFIGSDINKPAWKDSYTVQSSDGITIYRAKTFEVKTQVIIINKKDNKVRSVLIYNSTPKNILFRTKEKLIYFPELYRTKEKLTYFPDSIYIIQKYQKVRLLGANMYTIKGSLN